MFSRSSLRLIRNFKTSPVIRKKIYTESEEWILKNKNSYDIGITYNAIEKLSELVYIEFLNEQGSKVLKDDDLVIVESVKATDSIKAPFDCVILDNNIEIENSLDLINKNPEETWIIKVQKDE
jgi:glycine cleavage system H protein